MGIVYIFLLYKCLNKKSVYSIWQTITFHHSAKVKRSLPIRRQKSKTLSYLGIVLCPMNQAQANEMTRLLNFRRSGCFFRPIRNCIKSNDFAVNPMQHLS
jgi:hypothetical protein